MLTDGPDAPCPAYTVSVKASACTLHPATPVLSPKVSAGTSRPRGRLVNLLQNATGCVTMYSFGFPASQVPQVSPGLR